MCIDRLRADQLDAFRLTGAPLPALLMDVKIVANSKKRLYQKLLSSMRIKCGSQLVLRVEKQMVYKLMMMMKTMHKNRPLYPLY